MRMLPRRPMVKTTTKLAMKSTLLFLMDSGTQFSFFQVSLVSKSEEVQLYVCRQCSCSGWKPGNLKTEVHVVFGKGVLNTCMTLTAR